MTELSKRYQENKTASPKELDERILAAAKVQADENKRSHTRSSTYWMSGAAFACVCLIGITFILNTDTQKLTEDISHYESSQPVPLRTESDYSIAAETQLEEIIVTARKREENLEDKAMVISDELKEKRIMEKGPAQEISELETFESSARTFSVSSSFDESAPQQTVVLAEGRSSVTTPNLVSLNELIPGLILDIRYFSENNFVGAPIDGYLAPKALMTEAAALALFRVQEAALQQGFSLKVFDAYRPQTAVNHFVRWAEDLSDQKTKPIYYPNVDKSRLFEEGYIAEKSGHSRASTLDLTLVELSSGEELDMGTPFDFFDPISWPSSKEVSEEAQQNRLLLRKLMMDQGFKPYEAEWWHFTLADEPFPDQYFDIPVN